MNECQNCELKQRCNECSREMTCEEFREYARKNPEDRKGGENV